MPNTDKIFRDPLYNYVTVDKGRDAWLLDLIDTPEVKRSQTNPSAWREPFHLSGQQPHRGFRTPLAFCI